MFFRLEDARLREEQDREYQQAMEQDRLERQRREKEALELQRQQEEEEARQLEKEAIELSNRLTRESLMLSRRNSVGEEPASTSVDIATIRFQLPTGSKIARRFLKNDTVQVEKKMRCILNCHHPHIFFRKYTTICYCTSTIRIAKLKIYLWLLTFQK